MSIVESDQCESFANLDIFPLFKSWVGLQVSLFMTSVAIVTYTAPLIIMVSGFAYERINLFDLYCSTRVCIVEFHQLFLLS